MLIHRVRAQEHTPLAIVHFPGKKVDGFVYFYDESADAAAACLAATIRIILH